MKSNSPKPGFKWSGIQITGLYISVSCITLQDFQASLCAKVWSHSLKTAKLSLTLLLREIALSAFIIHTMHRRAALRLKNAHSRCRNIFQEGEAWNFFLLWRLRWALFAQGALRRFTQWLRLNTRPFHCEPDTLPLSDRLLVAPAYSEKVSLLTQRCVLIKD